ncbi:glycosyltransferase family 4 protein [Candidatus Pacearchaeota archaeon]|nr:glycosyltransferase family 4 protein [Candidatus Pacearchaeota archaeon]
MNILMLAWRDMLNPQKGGAEIVTDIYLKGLTNNNKVTLFSSSYKNSKPNETYNNYNIIRKGNKLSVYYHGLKFAIHNQNNYDIIIDQVNTIPFFTPLTIPKNKRVAFFHQLCKNIWFYETNPISATMGYIAESIYLKLYNNTKTFTVSNSTKQDLIKHTNNNPNNILVLDNHIDFKPITTKPKNKQNYFIYVGRLKTSKRIHHIIRAIHNLKNKNIKLIIVGDGDTAYKNKLNKLIKKLNLKNQIILTGKIPNNQRNKLMQNALAIIVTSVREGWGLIVTEANANHTIAITYNIHGLRDANTNHTGFITKENNPEALAQEMNKVIYDSKLRNEKEVNAMKFAREHSDWEVNQGRLEGWLKG